MAEKLFSPRVLALLWAIYAGATSLGYVGKAVDALNPVEAVLPTGSPAAAWALATMLLLVGAVLPPTGPPAKYGRMARLAGITLAGALLMMWATSYFIDAVDNHNRMWVSAKNYLMLAISAFASATVMGRNNAIVEGTNGGDKLD